MTQPITEADVLTLVRGAIKFPFPQVCKHLVALDLLNLLITKGYEVREELASAVVEARDEDALQLLDPELVMSSSGVEARLENATWIPGLDEACKLYNEGVISGGELFAAMAKADIPEALVGVVASLHNTAVEHARAAKKPPRQ